MEMLNIGFGGSVRASGIDVIVAPDSAPVKRLIADARAMNKLVDGTQGRKTRAVIVMGSGTVILSAIATETINDRLNSSYSNVVNKQTSEGQ